MAQINDLFKSTLVTLLGRDGHIDGLIREFLQLQTGSSTRDITDLWNEFVISLGYPGPTNDGLFQYFRDQGLTGAYNDMFIQALVNGLLDFSAIQQEDGAYIMQEDGLSLILQEPVAAGFCSGFGGEICMDGSDASAFDDAGSSGTITSDGTKFIANCVFDYAGSIAFATTIGVTYNVTMTIVDPTDSNIYVEAYQDDGIPGLTATGISNVEPMNNEIGETGVVTGSFVAASTGSQILFGEDAGGVAAFTFKDLKIEAA